MLRRQAALYDMVRRSGKRVLSHCCGNVREIVPDLIEAGLDVLQSIQAEAMDPYALKAEFGGSLCLWGGLGTQRLVPFGTPGAIRAEVRRLCASRWVAEEATSSARRSPCRRRRPTENAAAVVEAFVAEAGVTVDRRRADRPDRERPAHPTSERATTRPLFALSSAANVIAMVARLSRALHSGSRSSRRAARNSSSTAAWPSFASRRLRGDLHPARALGAVLSVDEHPAALPGDASPGAFDPPVARPGGRIPVRAAHGALDRPHAIGEAEDRDVARVSLVPAPRQVPADHPGVEGIRAEEVAHRVEVVAPHVEQEHPRLRDVVRARLVGPGHEERDVDLPRRADLALRDQPAGGRGCGSNRRCCATMWRHPARRPASTISRATSYRSLIGFSSSIGRPRREARQGDVAVDGRGRDVEDEVGRGPLERPRQGVEQPVLRHAPLGRRASARASLGIGEPDDVHVPVLPAEVGPLPPLAAETREHRPESTHAKPPRPCGLRPPLRAYRGSTGPPGAPSTGPRRAAGRSRPPAGTAPGG